MTAVNTHPAASPQRTPPPHDPIVTAIRENPSAALALAGAGLVVLRLLAVSDFRTDVALALLSSGGAANIATGAAVSLVPLILPLLAVQLIGMAGASEPGQRRAIGTDFAAIGAGFLAILAAPVALVVVVVAIATASWTIDKRRAKRGKGSYRIDVGDSLTYLLISLGYTTFLYAATLSGPWLPREAITIAGTPRFTGYVAASDPRWTTILIENPRLVRIVGSSTVVDRTTCATQPSVWTSPLKDLSHPLPLPECPE